MKKVNDNGMWGSKVLALAALGMMAALTLDLGLIKAAKADVKVRASVRTPVVDVDFVNDGYYQSNKRYRTRGHRPRGRHLPRPRVKIVQHDDWRHEIVHGKCLQFPLTRRDRKIAKRLARQTGYAKRDLIHLKRDGYTWWEISRLLEISPRTLRWALRGGRNYHSGPGYGYRNWGSCGNG